MIDPKRIRLLYAGTFTATDGRTFTYTPADLAEIAESYDPATDPAPLVVGHPKLDTPAFGWAKSVAVEDGELVAYPDPDKLDPAFAEAVKAGRYGRISASLYERTDPNNPKPGRWSLKHIGFLGGAAPAVKGLGMVSFAESEGVITLETDQENSMPIPPEFAERETALNEGETALADKVRLFEEQQATARHESHVAFAEVLVERGSLAPTGTDLVVGIMDQLATAGPVSFGEANGELAPLAAFKKLFEGAGTIVAFGEHARPPADKGKGDEDPQVIANKAVAYCESEKAAGRIVTVAVAVRKVTAESKAAAD